MKHVLPLIAAALALAPSIAGCADHDRTSEHTGIASSSIIGGMDDSNDPAVVAIFVDTFGLQLCSGVLVAPRMVLTAGHCAFGTLNVSAHFGLDALHPDRSIAVVARATHPQFTKEGAPYDFAVFELETAVTDIAPIPLRTTPLSATDIGTNVRHVGYGVSNEEAGSGNGTKRTVTYPVTRVDDTIFYSGAPGKQTCDYDSGAPGLIVESDGIERVAGIVSDGPSCHEDGWDGRVDLAALQSFIKDTQASWDMANAPSAPKSGGCAIARTSSRDDATFVILFGALTLAFAGMRARRRRAS